MGDLNASLLWEVYLQAHCLGVHMHQRTRLPLRAPAVSVPPCTPVSSGRGPLICKKLIQSPSQTSRYTARCQG